MVTPTPSRTLRTRRTTNIYAELSLFGVDFSLSIGIPSRAGIVVKGTYIGTVDLKFITLGPYPLGAPETTGPTLSIDTTKQTVSSLYSLMCSWLLSTRD